MRVKHIHQLQACIKFTLNILTRFLFPNNIFSSGKYYAVDDAGSIHVFDVQIVDINEYETITSLKSKFLLVYPRFTELIARADRLIIK